MSKCVGKVRYRKQRNARKQLRLMRTVYADAWEQHVYRCDQCGGWHIGTRKELCSVQRWRWGKKPLDEAKG